jgi:carbamoyltransferase
VPGLNNFGYYYWVWAHHIYSQKVQKNIRIGDPKYRETYCGKVMGLSAYGNTKEFSTDYRMTFEGIPAVTFTSEPMQDRVYGNMTPENKAKVLQHNFEQGMLEYMKELKRQSYITDNLCLAGGVFLNILANSVIRKAKIADNIHIPPFPDDSGLSFGAACYGVFKNKEEVKIPHNISLFGKTYSDDEIKEELESYDGISYQRYEDFGDLCEVTAGALADNKIIGWFQNRSEFGPRALGSRSILMNPTPKQNKDLINSRIKHREYWRPFAGIMLEEYQSEYFVEDYPSEYMLYSLIVKPHQRKKLGAITHADFTCRIQTVNKDLNPEVTILLNKYNQITQCPILLNTSFNDNGQPIVESPKDAINTFKNIDLDYLVIGNYIVSKK